MDILLAIISIIVLVVAVPKILDKEDQQHQENEKDSLEDIIDVDITDNYQKPDNQNTNKLYTPSEIFQLDDLEIFARTLYGEGRNLPKDEIEKIAWVIRNRVKDNGRENFHDTYGEVCLQKFQFSCWNSLYLSREMTENQKEVRRNVLRNQNSYQLCLQIAKNVISASELENPLDRVQHYVLNTDEVKINGDQIEESPYPEWTKNLKIVDNDGKGSHIFLG